MTIELPNISAASFDTPSLDRRNDPPRVSTHPPRILLLYGSLRERSFSRLLTLEAERILKRYGADTRVFDPRGLPLPDGAPPSHPNSHEFAGACPASARAMSLRL